MSEPTGPRGRAGDQEETGSAPVLAARALRKDYGRGGGLVRAVDGVDLTVAAGETLAVMGPSGCGKSTLLHLLGGLDRPSGGEIWLSGQRIDPMGERALARLRREAVGFVFQAFHLMDELTAVENVGRRDLGPGRGQVRHRPGHWSGGPIGGRVDLHPVAGGQDRHLVDGRHGVQPGQHAAQFRGRHGEFLEDFGRGGPVGHPDIHNRHRRSVRYVDSGRRWLGARYLLAPGPRSAPGWISRSG